MENLIELHRLDPQTFEHLVNALAIRVLGNGTTGFGPGSDGGRDGYFEGEANYPSERERWSGRWYIQSKYHRPHLSKDPQKWLLQRIEEELESFKSAEGMRAWPDNWIIATNIDPSGVPETGLFDRARQFVSSARPELAGRFAIWGGGKLLTLLQQHRDIAEAYGHFLTPGQVLSELYKQFQSDRNELEAIINHLIVRGLRDHQHTKLEQAGSASETRPGLQKLFVDLPIQCAEFNLRSLALQHLCSAAAESHRPRSGDVNGRTWRKWSRHPSRARVWFIKGGPGQGKSTLTQFICQIQRASLILQRNGPTVVSRDIELASEIRSRAEDDRAWPAVPRIPVAFELRDYAHWFGQVPAGAAKGLLSYWAFKMTAAVEQQVSTGSLRRLLASRSWLMVFDGLDEVPHDVKDDIAREVIHFIDGVAVEADCDLLSLCTSRPQGYSGQFEALEAPTVELLELSPPQALACALPVVTFDRPVEEAQRAMETLASAIDSPAVRQIMKTPLQSHIMAIIVRDGGRPPERRWQLFTTFYNVIRRREANRQLPQPRLSRLLREDDQLIKSVHNRLGFVLHGRAETSEGAQTTLTKPEFRDLVEQAVAQLVEDDEDELVQTLMEATQERLVLVSTPDDGNHLRFDVRQLQEFFAAEFIYESINLETFRARLEVIAADQHWREVMHFLLSALVENGRRTELAVALQVLQGVDGDGCVGPERVLRRRLAAGAILVSRLVQEGVLEQDRRYRQDFRPALHAIGGLLDPLSLHGLVGALPAQTRRWLIRLASDTIRESSVSESLGWFVVLSRVARDSDNPELQLRKIFSRLQPREIGLVLESFSRSPTDGGSDIDLAQRIWLLDVIATTLTAPNWHEMNSRAIMSCVYILRNNAALVAEHASAALNAAEQGLVYGIAAYSDTPSAEAEDRIGHITVRRYPQDWTMREERHLSAPVLAALKEPVRGFFGMLQALFAFYASPSFETAQVVFTYDTFAWDGLPSALRVLFPFPESEAEFARVKNLSRQQFEAILERGSAPEFGIISPVLVYSYFEVAGEDTLQRLLDEHPIFGINHWADIVHWGVDDERAQAFSTPRVVDDVIKVMSRIPADIVGLRPVAQAMRVAPDRVGDLYKIVARIATTSPSRRYWQESGPGFTVHLPQDSGLLPHVLLSILPASDYDEDGYPFPNPGVQIETLQTRLVAFFPDADALTQIAADPDSPASVRGFALIALLLHPACEITLEDCWPDLVKHLGDPGKGWEIQVLSRYLQHVGSPENESARLLLGTLFERDRLEGLARSELDEVVAVWREESLSPVTTGDYLDVWLSGER